MKPLRQKQQEALERRKTNLETYKKDKHAVEFFKDGIALTTDEERAAFLSRKIATAEEDIKKLENILESSY